MLDINDELCPLTDMFESVSEYNYLQFCQIANIQYIILFKNEKSSGYDFVNWRVNFANLNEFIMDNLKNGEEISEFLKLYDESAPVLYKKLGLEYSQKI
jgi:hypothetical protein